MRYAAIYARQSIEKKNSISIEGQQEMCRNAAGEEEVKLYQDRGYSGKNTDRPDFQRLLKDIRAGKISKIYVYRLDRFSRSIADFSQLWKTLQKHNVEFISVTENFDTASPMGRAMLHIIMVFAQLERETTSERVHDNYAARAGQGAWPGGPAPYGFALGRAVDNSGRSYASLVPDDKTAAAQERDRQMEERLDGSARRAEALRQDGDYPFPLTESERLVQSRQREQALREELEAALAQLREQSAAQVTGSPAVTTAQEQSRAVSAPSEDDAALVVRRIRQSSDYFHTVSENDPQPNLIKAIVDEDIKAVDGSRVRLRLLDDVEIGNLFMPKGSYLFAIMSGFSSQRVKGTVKSVLLYDEIVKVNLSLYDTDGLEGLYVPSSSFRETARDVAGAATGSTMSINQGGYNNSLSQWGMQAVQNAYQRTASAVGKVIRKNTAHLKYGTFVYLVNGNQTRTE